MPGFENIKAIVTDIEGTTSSISFVKDVLFPYAADQMQNFVKKHQTEAAVQAQLQAVANLSGIDETNIDALIQQLKQWIADDKKITPLKALQGMIWEQGYADGAYKAHIYADAVSQLKSWQQTGLPLYVYSSGSIKAQHLFFRYSEVGDLTGLFSGHFDTTSGGKQEENAYRNIAAAIAEQQPAIRPNNLLFLSDIKQELMAAQAAGWQCCWLLRPQDSALRAEHGELEGFTAVSTFSEIELG